MHLASEAAVRRRVADTPVTYVLFDLLFLEGRELHELPYTDRRKLLGEPRTSTGPRGRPPPSTRARAGRCST